MREATRTEYLHIRCTPEEKRILLKLKETYGFSITMLLLNAAAVHYFPLINNNDE